MQYIKSKKKKVKQRKPLTLFSTNMMMPCPKPYHDLGWQAFPLGKR